MHEGFELQLAAGTIETNLVDRHLAWQHNTADTELAHELGCFGRAHGHLRRRVHGQVRTHRATEARYPEILHDHGVGTGARNRCQQVARTLELAIPHERIKCNVAFDAVRMQIIEHPGQGLRAHVGCFCPGVEAGRESEVDRVGSGRDRGAQTFLIAGRSQQFKRGRRCGPGETFIRRLIFRTHGWHQSDEYYLFLAFTLAFCRSVRRAIQNFESESNAATASASAAATASHRLAPRRHTWCACERTRSKSRACRQFLS